MVSPKKLKGDELAHGRGGPGHGPDSEAAYGLDGDREMADAKNSYSPLGLCGQKNRQTSNTQSRQKRDA
jgi:hypothetical protein